MPALHCTAMHCVRTGRRLACWCRSRVPSLCAVGNLTRRRHRRRPQTDAAARKLNQARRSWSDEWVDGLVDGGKLPQGGKGSGAPRLSIEDAMPKEERFYCSGQCRTMRKSSAAQPAGDQASADPLPSGATRDTTWSFNLSSLSCCCCSGCCKSPLEILHRYLG